MTQKHRQILSVLLLLALCVASTAYAGTYANDAFSSTEVAFNAAFNADFIAYTTRAYPSIFVSVTLQRKDGDKWVFDRSLPAPTFSGSNTNTWVASKDYSAYGTAGQTYRIKAVFNASGTTATAYSVARTK